MIKFDINKVRIEHIYIRSVTQALGGSCTTVDMDTNIATRIPVPYSVSRRFIKEHKMQTYVVPVLSAVMYYGDIAVALERHHLGNLGVEESDGLWGKKRWQSGMEKFLEKIRAQISTGDWYVDGSYIYRPQADYRLNKLPLSSDGKWTTVGVDAYKFADMQKEESVRSDTMKLIQKHCIMYTTAGGNEVLSPPIWSNIKSISKDKERAIMKQEENLHGDLNVVLQGQFPYDTINDTLMVNINFALSAATELSRAFGYECIEPLGLDDLMVKMQTVNLPSLEAHVKKTCEIGMTYTHAMAWLMGFVNRSQDLDQLMNVRSLIKYLSSTGTYQKRKLDKAAIFRDGMDVNMIPVLDCSTFAAIERPKIVVQS